MAGPMSDEVLTKTLASAGIPVLNFNAYGPAEIEKAIEKAGVVKVNLPFLPWFTPLMRKCCLDRKCVIGCRREFQSASRPHICHRAGGAAARHVQG